MSKNIVTFKLEDYKKIKRVTKGKFGRNWQALN